jgi:hypothetical protein
MAFHMKVKVNGHLWVLAALALVFTGCTETYIGDIVDPRLPAYTEIGQNDAGAFVNGMPWRASPEWRPNNSSTNAGIGYVDSIATGTLGLPWGYLVLGEDIPSPEYAISFIFNFDLYAHFVQNGELPIVIDLDGASGYAILRGQDHVSSTNCRSSQGKLYIRHFGTNNSNESIISGTFGFVVEDDCGIYSVTSGRFDFVIDRWNF